jgi:uncharacterized membrane protein
MNAGNHTGKREAGSGSVAARALSMARRYLAGLSVSGLLLAGVFFALSLAPSLMPRAPLIQGVLSGLSMAAGYWIGLALEGVWRFLELPRPPERVRRLSQTVLAVGALVLIAGALWNAAEWQDRVRAFLGIEPIDATYAPVVLAVALPLALLLRETGRGAGWTLRSIARAFDRVLPRRVSLLLSIVVFGWLVNTVAVGTLGRWTAQSLDATFLALDQLVDEGLTPPSTPDLSGGPGSLVSWVDLGRQGRRFVSQRPSAADIARVAQIEALPPIRVYVGLGAAESPEGRARIALAELKRTGAFERSVLVLATPTGTGWVDEAAIEPLEYLHGGDTAVVALQYSYLTSYVSLFLEPGFSVAGARALFEEIYAFWTSLPRDARPRLYLHGLSLGSYGSEQSMEFHEVLADPIHGAVWSGPTFQNPAWASFTARRRPDSPIWLPRYGDGSVVRFSNQQTAPQDQGDHWGPVRFAYLQYASDPITFFSPDLFFREPSWLSGPRGPDVSPDLTWRPIVTGLQVAFDMIGASSFGPGVGHLFAASHYLDAWTAVTGYDERMPPDIEAIRAHLADQRGL